MNEDLEGNQIEVKITYTDFDSKYDEWLPTCSDRLLRMFIPEM